MGVFKNEIVLTSASVPAEKMFKGLCLEVDAIMPKAAPHAYKNVEIKGDGGPGTLRCITLPDESPVKSMTLRNDAIDKDTLTYDYSIVDGDILSGFIESVNNRLTVVPHGAGSITKISVTFNIKGDAVIPEESIKFGEEMNKATFNAIEAYLIAN